MTSTSAERESKPRKRKRSESSKQRFARQELVFGDEGQRRIEGLRVAVVGVGGTGSHVVQQLAYLGVRNFILVDHDHVDCTNLNRLVGAGTVDIGAPKVKVAERMIQFIAGNERVSINAFPVNLRTREAFESLKDADVLLGCVDMDGPRLVLNELALAYMIPYIDCGTGVNSAKEIGGQVVVVQPDGPCLLCARLIDIRVASDELAPADEFMARKMQGYVAGADVPSPAVISLNGIVSSAAVNEFLALATGLRPVQVYTYYDMTEQRMGPRLVKPNPQCVACTVKGLGDRANVDRYLEVNVPKNIPRPRNVQP